MGAVVSPCLFAAEDGASSQRDWSGIALPERIGVHEPSRKDDHINYNSNSPLATIAMI